MPWPACILYWPIRSPDLLALCCADHRLSPAPSPHPPAGGSADLVLNQLVKHTAVQGRFSCNMVALVGATPKTLTLKDFLRHWLDFRCGCVWVGLRSLQVDACMFGLAGRTAGLGL